MTRWEALNARARGLRTHLLGRRELEAMTRVTDLAALADRLRAAGFPVLPAGGEAPAALEQAVRRRAAAHLATLGRWTGPRAAAATLLFDDEDRRGVRNLLRGAAAHADPDDRLAGTMPTRALPERALQELARQASPRAVAALLVAWKHPFGPAVFAAASPGQADLLRIEFALNRAFADRARVVAGGGPLADYVRESIDLENAGTALMLAGHPDDLVPKDAFLPGGSRIGIDEFEQAIATGTAAGAGARLARAFHDARLARVFARAGDDLAAVEDAVLRARLAGLRQAARLDPLGPAPLIGFVLGLRAESADLRRLIWGVALAAPAALMANDLVAAG